MFVHRRNPLDPVGGAETPEPIANSRRARRRLLAAAAGAGAAAALGGYGLWRRWLGGDAEVVDRGRIDERTERVLAPHFPAPRDIRFEYGRPETIEAEAARYTNFYEFSRFKRSWRLVDAFEAEPWTITIDGLCRNPLKLTVNEFMDRFRDAAVERQYRHRCVERWAMAIPWSGVPLRNVLSDVDPLESATHVRFVSFHRPEQAPGMADLPTAPWPYCEGLTMAEAANELPLVATGMYGHPLLKQHGAPLRLVVPWKYGYKSIKSIERIELVDREPTTFWTTLVPEAYPFQSNVDPHTPRPWPQTTETMLGTGDTYPTQPFNGYGPYVANLYA